MVSEELQFLFSGLCWKGKLHPSASGRAENKDLWAKILVGSLVKKMPWIKTSDKLSYGSYNLSRHHFHTVITCALSTKSSVLIKVWERRENLQEMHSDILQAQPAAYKD